MTLAILDGYGHVTVLDGVHEYTYFSVPESLWGKVRRKCCRGDKSLFADLARYARRDLFAN